MRSVALGELCEIRSGGTPSRSNAAFYGGSIPWAKISDIEASNGFLDSTEESITDAGLKAIRGRLFSEGTLLFAIYGSIGKMAFASRELSTNQAILGIQILDPKKVDARYLFRWLESRRDQLLADGLGIAQKNLSAGYLRALEIPLPPLEEQKRIAAILDQADALRRLRQRAIDRLNTLGQAIFYEMFGDPATNPFAFDSCYLGQIIEFIGGSQPPKANFLYENGPGRVRFVQIRDFRTDDYKTYVPEYLAKRPFQEDDVMIGRYGPPVFQIFRGLSGTYNVALMKAQPAGGVTKDFVYYLLQEHKLHSYVVANSERTAGQSGVNLRLLEGYPAYKPPMEKQLEFSERIREVDKLVKEATKQQGTTEHLFSSLQHRAFRGEL
jgi:type I restriction enzyme S subunit